jgi:hypothetical protein
MDPLLPENQMPIALAGGVKKHLEWMTQQMGWDDLGKYYLNISIIPGLESI